MASTAHTVTARRDRRCEGWRCWAWIKAGEEYVRSVIFPGHDANGTNVPLVLRLCRGCRTEYGREMPPRRTRRARKEKTDAAR